MRFLTDMRVGARLGAAFGALIVAALLVAGYGRYALGRIIDEVTIVVDDRMVKVDQLSDVKDNLNVVARATRNIALLEDADARAKEKARIDEARAKYSELLQKLQASIRSEKGQAKLASLLEARGPYAAANEKAIALGMANQSAAAAAVLLKEARAPQAAYFKALDELRKAGVISAIGVGINESDTSLRFIQAGDFDCMLLAGRYTLLEQGALEAFLPECTKRNVSVILGGPYNSGILTGGVKETATHDYVQAPRELIEKARRIEAVCQRHGVELGAAAMQFPLFHPAFCAVIPGALSVAEVKQNVARTQTKIPVELWSELKREKLIDPASPTPN